MKKKKSAVTEDSGALYAADRAQLGLQNTRQIIGNLLLIEIGEREAQGHRHKLRVGSFQFEDRRARSIQK